MALANVTSWADAVPAAPRPRPPTTTAPMAARTTRPNLTGEALVITCLQFSKRNARAQGPTSTFTYPLVQQH